MMNDDHGRSRRRRLFVVLMGITAAGLGLALAVHVARSSAAPAHGFESAEPQARSIRISSGSSRGKRPSNGIEALDPETARRQTAAWWDGVRKGHEGQPRDTAWAGTAERSFESEVAALAERRTFSVVAVDCRTTSCRVRLTWPSYSAGEVRNDAKLIAEHSYRQNCATNISAPPPEDTRAPYQADAVFDCSSARRGVASR